MFHLDWMLFEGGTWIYFCKWDSIKIPEWRGKGRVGSHALLSSTCRPRTWDSPPMPVSVSAQTWLLWVSPKADQLDRFLPARVQPSVCVLTAPLFHH